MTSAPHFENRKSPGDLKPRGVNGSAVEKRWDARQVSGDCPRLAQGTNTHLPREHRTLGQRHRHAPYRIAPRQRRAAPNAYRALGSDLAHRDSAPCTGSHIEVPQTPGRTHSAVSRASVPTPIPPPARLGSFPAPPCDAAAKALFLNVFRISKNPFPFPLRIAVDGDLNPTGSHDCRKKNARVGGRQR